MEREKAPDPFGDVTGRLALALEGSARPIDAQRRFSPRLRDGSVVPRHPAERQAAALLLLFPRDGHAHLVLTLRASHLPHHADQVSLPGGRMEPDETIEAAALREAQEEIGLDPAVVCVLGRLTPMFIPVSGFTLHVVVGSTPAPPTLSPEPGEVAAVLDVSLDDLRDPSRIETAVWTRDGREIQVPYFVTANGHQVWGATAMALAELLALAGYDVDPWPSARQ